MIASPGFDASVTDVWPALTAGACICVPDQETRLTPARLQAWLLERGVTVTEVATPLAELLLDLPWPSDCSLRLLITGGDRLDSRPRPEIPFRLLNEYGPTENTATSTAGVVAPVGQAEGLPPIGGPIAGTTAHIVDAAMQPTAGRRHGRAAAGWSRRRPGVPGPPGPDGGALPPRPVRRPSRAAASTSAATASAAWRTARSTSSVARTARSRSAASASSWARSPPRCAATRLCTTPM